MSVYFDRELNEGQKPINNSLNKTYKVNMNNIKPGLFQPFNEDDFDVIRTQKIN